MSVKDQVREASGSSESLPTAVQGIVNSTPASEGELLRVVIPGFDQNKIFECYWMPRGIAIPRAGDVAFVDQDADGDYWAVAWYPAEASPAAAIMGAAVYSGGSYPPRPSATAVTWIGPTAPPTGPGGAIAGVDIWVKT